MNKQDRSNEQGAPEPVVRRHILWPGGGEDAHPRLVWRSTRESYDANVVSVVAIGEVALAMGLYWWLIPMWFQTHWHLVASVCIAPLLLLRSPQSIAKALDRFERYLGLRSPLSLSLLLLAAAVGFVATYGLAGYWLAGQEGWALFWRAGLVGFVALNLAVAVAGAVAIAVARARALVVAEAGVGVAVAVAVAVVAEAGVGVGIGAGVVFGVVFVFGVGVGVGILARALFEKIWATTRYLPEGWPRLSANWRRLVFAQDLFRAPELLPDQHRRPALGQFSFQELFSELTSRGDLVYRAFMFSFLLILFLPAWFYRLSLKSTFWFYWPLVFAQGRMEGARVSAKTLCETHTKTLAGLPLALFALALGISPFLPLWSGLDTLVKNVPGLQAEHLDLIALLGDKALLVWPAALVSLVLYASANLLTPRANNGDFMPKHRTWLNFLIGLRWVLVLTALLVGALLFAADAVPAYMPAPILDFAAWSHDGLARLR